MRLEGFLAYPGRPVVDIELAHGADPSVVSHDAGFVVRRPLEVSRDEAGELVLRLEVRPVRPDDRRPVVPGRGRDAGLQVPSGTTPVRRQRVAAYAVVTSTSGLLATEYSDLTAVPGRWGMPGGGLDDGEEPTAATLREVQEETAQTVVLGDLFAVQTSHWLGRSPRGVLEDFHAVRLVYRAHCPTPTRPEVLDVGGTTASARWVPLAAWRTLPWTHNWEHVLADLLT